MVWQFGVLTLHRETTARNAMPKNDSFEIKALMATLWMRHRSGAGRLPGSTNVFEVLLPPPSEAELREAHDRMLRNPDLDIEQRLRIAAYCLGG